MREIEGELCALVCEAFPFGGNPPSGGALTSDMWQALATTAQAQGMTGVLFAAIQKLARKDLPSDVFAELQDTVRKTALAQALAYRDLFWLVRQTDTLAREMIVLKGAALAKTLYPESFERSFGDVDVFIHKEDAELLKKLLLANKFHETRELASGFREDYYGETGFYRDGTSGTRLDLHWELVEPAYYRRRMDTRWFWANTEPVQVAGGTLRVLNPTAQVVHLSAHLGLHHQDKPRLVWFYDLALLMTRRGSEIDWRAADAFVRASSLARPLQFALDGVREWWGVERPIEARGLFVPNRLNLGERTVYALTTTAFTEARTLSDVLETPGIGEKLRFARKQLLPDRTYMHRRYGFTNDALLPFYYVRRVFESGFKFTRSVWTAVTR